MKHLAIIGSSGSIGRQVKDVAARYPDLFCIESVCVNTNIASVYEDVARFRPRYVGIADESAAKSLDRSRLGGAEIFVGEQATEQCASVREADTAVVSVVGMVGLRAVMAALGSGKRIALANKESLVTGGEIVMREASERGLAIYPVDSEHSAIWQCLRAGRQEDVARLVLTASGGPFRGRTRDELAHVTVAETLRHPTWNMGSKITVDSATLMNKGLEVIEAYRLFGTDRIDVILQPTSIVHSMVEFRDGSVIAQMGNPSMELPIQLALTYPERIPAETPRLDFERLGSIPFEPVDTETFGCLGLALEALKRGGLIPTVLNAANEAAVALFLGERIGFLDIERLVREALDADYGAYPLTVDGIFALDTEVKRRIRERF